MSNEDQELSYLCPRCEHPLQNVSSQEGGWCPECEEWFPIDLVLEEED